MPKCYQPIYLKKQNIIVACGKCLNCQSNKKREYGHRASVEIEQYKYKQFATITYNDIYLPINNFEQATLEKKEIVDYIKRLDIAQKRRYRAEGKEAIMKYFIAGEYGESTERPHYHLVIGSNTPISYNLKTLWEKGNIKAEDIISRKAISYSVGYTQKKQWEERYNQKEEPFHKFSRGMGKLWFEEKWEKGEISTEKYLIENMNYNMSIGTYYKYLLRKRFYNYNMDDLNKFYGKMQWDNFQKEIKENIEKKREELDKLNQKHLIEKFGHGTAYEKIKRNLINQINEIKNNKAGELAWKDICEVMKACKEQREFKKLKAEAEAKFWMKAKIRNKVA